MKKLIYAILFLMLSLTSAWAQTTPEKLFEEATQHYNNGEYEAALKNYEQILAQEQESAALYYNMANAHYKLNAVAPSIYYYEKALQLAPHDEDIQNNLSFAENMRVDAIEEVPKTGLSKIVNDVISVASFEQWGYFSIAFAALFSLCFLGYYFSASSLRKRLLFTASIVLLVLFISSGVIAFQQRSHFQARTFAIVFPTEISVQNEPNQRSEEAFLLHEGTKVRILEDFNGYFKIELADGTQGWVNQTDVKEL